MYLGMKILQNKINGTQTSFSSNFGAKLSFIMPFLALEHHRCCYIYFHQKYYLACYMRLRVQNMHAVIGENMDGANGQTGGKNRNSTFVLTAFISFHRFNILIFSLLLPVQLL
jgi:hypothetical protein